MPDSFDLSSVFYCEATGHLVNIFDKDCLLNKDYRIFISKDIEKKHKVFESKNGIRLVHKNAIDIKTHRFDPDSAIQLKSYKFTRFVNKFESSSKKIIPFTLRKDFSKAPYSYRTIFRQLELAAFKKSTATYVPFVLIDEYVPSDIADVFEELANKKQNKNRDKVILLVDFVDTFINKYPSLSIRNVAIYLGLSSTTLAEYKLIKRNAVDFVIKAYLNGDINYVSLVELSRVRDTSQGLLLEKAKTMDCRTFRDYCRSYAKGFAVNPRMPERSSRNIIMDGELYRLKDIFSIVEKYKDVYDSEYKDAYEVGYLEALEFVLGIDLFSKDGGKILRKLYKEDLLNASDEKVEREAKQIKSQKRRFWQKTGWKKRRKKSS